MEDSQLLQAFEACTLPGEAWTHRAHVRMGFLYLRAHPFEVALVKMREGILALNAAHGVINSPTSGYNETTTQAFLRLIHATMRAYGAGFPTPDSESFCDTHPQLMSRQVLRFFYSPGRRMHPDAWRQFVEPDLTALPGIEPADPRPSPKE